jgi:lactate permease
MISPQSIAIGAAAVGLTGKESELFRFTVKHSFVMLLVISIITMIQAYVLPAVVPVYEKLGTGASNASPQISQGFVYLSILLAVLIAVWAVLKILERVKSEE